MVPSLYEAAHAPLRTPAAIAQVMPLGTDCTVPLPVPVPETVRPKVGRSNRAVTTVGAVTPGLGTAHVLTPEHAPPQPVNTLLPVAVAENSGAVGEAIFTRHIPLAPLGVIVQAPLGPATVPVPVPPPDRIS